MGYRRFGVPADSPMFMPLRAALTTVPAWQMLTVVVLMLAGIAVLIRVGGRLYRGAVLRTAGALEDPPGVERYPLTNRR